MKKFLLLFLLSPYFCFGHISHPFDYDLNVVTLPGSGTRTMICFHGYGNNYQIAHLLQKFHATDSTLVSFNFPDHDIQLSDDHSGVSLGTLKELLPAIYVMKQAVVENQLQAIDLYGFSAGGGAVVNILGILNTSAHDAELAAIGISVDDKKMVLDAVQKGIVILDVPLKSVDEIIDLRGASEPLTIVAQKYRENNLRPIDNLERLKGLKLDLIIHFQEEDEILFNRDDALYIERITAANCLGNTEVVTGNDGGHSRPHKSLWETYAKKITPGL